jgi:hypothetical protein
MDTHPATFGTMYPFGVVVAHPDTLYEALENDAHRWQDLRGHFQTTGNKAW